MYKILILSALCLISVGRNLAQEQPVISSFSGNGDLVCSNLQPGTAATVEWASTPAGPWKSSWTELDGVVADANGSIHVSVPMFYRVRGTPRETVSIQTSATSVALLESNTTVLQVRLTAQPPANVTVSAASANPAKVTLSPATLTLTPANWNTYQNLTLTAVNDSDAREESTSLTLSAPGLYDKEVGVTVMDDEQALVLSNTSLFVTEGASLSLGVRLSGQPAGNVTVNVASANTAVATVVPATLTFTPANWSTNQSVSVSGVQDADSFNGNTTLHVYASVVASGPSTVAVTVMDDD